MCTLRDRKFLFVLPSLELGGAERQALLLARYLVREEHARVEIWGFGAPGAVTQALAGTGIACRPLPLPPPGARVQQMRMAAEFVRAARRARPEVLLPYSRVPNRVCGLLWRWTGARLCVWNQRDGGTLVSPTPLDRLAIRRVPAIVANSNHGATQLAKRYGLHDRDIVVVRNGVELDPPRDNRVAWRQRLGADEDTFIACMLANITSNKDHATLVRAWRLVVDRLERERRRALLLLAGTPGDTYAAVHGLVRDFDLEAQVSFVGQTTDVAGVLHASDLGVFSSRHEGSPNGVLECMAAGLAVVGTDIDGIREALGDEGLPWLAPPGDASRFADLVLAITLDPTRRQQAGRDNRRRIAETFSACKMGKQMAALCARALERVR